MLSDTWNNNLRLSVAKPLLGDIIWQFANARRDYISLVVAPTKKKSLFVTWTWKTWENRFNEQRKYLTRIFLRHWNLSGHVDWHHFFHNISLSPIGGRLWHLRDWLYGPKIISWCFTVFLWLRFSRQYDKIWCTTCQRFANAMLS